MGRTAFPVFSASTWLRWPRSSKLTLEIGQKHLASNGYLHAASVIALADYCLRLRVCGFSSCRSERLHHPGVEVQPPWDRSLGNDHGRRQPGSRWPHHPGMGCGGELGRKWQNDRPVPLHPANSLPDQVSEGHHPAGVILIHGGLYEPIGPDEFWHGPGVVAGLGDRRPGGSCSDSNDRCDLVDRRGRASSSNTPDDFVPMVGCGGLQWMFGGGEDGGRLQKLLVDRLVLCWPATAGDPDVDQMERAPVEHAGRRDLCRGVSDAELANISVPVTIIPSQPPNRHHQAVTVDRLLSLIPGATATRGFPESPRPEFLSHRDAFVATLIPLLESDLRLATHPISSFQRAGLAAMNLSIRLLQSSRWRITKSTPRDLT